MNRSKTRSQQVWRDFKCRVFGHAMHVKSREPGHFGDAQLYCAQCGRFFRSRPGRGIWVDAEPDPGRVRRRRQ